LSQALLGSAVDLFHGSSDQIWSKRKVAKQADFLQLPGNQMFVHQPPQIHQWEGQSNSQTSNQVQIRVAELAVQVRATFFLTLHPLRLNLPIVWQGGRSS
jgi:hypothetical protein